MDGTTVSVLSFAITLLLFLPLYFLPAFIAYRRRHANRAPILLTTLFFGWTTIGWVIALIWSFSANKEKPE